MITKMKTATATQIVPATISLFFDVLNNTYYLKRKILYLKVSASKNNSYQLIFYVVNHFYSVKENVSDRIRDMNISLLNYVTIIFLVATFYYICLIDFLKSTLLMHLYFINYYGWHLLTLSIHLRCRLNQLHEYENKQVH